MKFLIVCALLAAADAGAILPAGRVEQEVVPGVAGEHLVRGPSTKTRLLGPDGSQVTADAAGGAVVPEAVPVVAEVVLSKTIVEPVLPVVLARALDEGQYVPDDTEKLYDDGSYKPSPVEEADDGSYKGEQ